MSDPAETSTNRAPRPELLAPAGDLDCVKAAVENGADAVYFGLDAGFNARARAHNFAADSLPEVMDFLHGRGVRGYVTLNTLAFSEELPQVEQIIRRLTVANVDALIVQDLGLARLARLLSPDLPIHASTQMTVTSAEGVRLVESLGVERVILARELSIDEIRKIRRQTTLPLEVFVHGALCVAYSGQCLTSESLGGRSANRGQCAQACRLPYDLVCDGKDVDLGDMKYLLSPQDLAAYELVPALVEIGVACLKIEGRLKTPEYVANITRHYREAIDVAMTGMPVQFTPRQVEEMELSFSRGFSKGWLRGCDHKELVQGLTPTKRGVFVGEVKSVRKGRILAALAGPVKRGDGLAFDSGRPDLEEEGGRVYEIFRQGESVADVVSTGTVELAFGAGAIDLRAIAPGQKIWKTDDPELTRRLRQSFSGTKPRRLVPINLEVVARTGSPLELTVRTDSGADFRLASSELLATAAKHPLTADSLREQFGRLGGTAYELRNLTAVFEGVPMAPFSVLGKLRHQMVERLDASMIARPLRRLSDDSSLELLRSAPMKAIPILPEGEPKEGAPEPSVLCRALTQVDVALGLGIREFYIDFHDIREHAEGIARVHRAGGTAWLATPRIQKPSERGIFQVMLRQGADGILVRNLGGLVFFGERGVPMIGDFSLNAANELAVQFLLERGLTRVTASYDMNRDQLLDLVAVVPAQAIEVVVHQHMPMFHMEHCVFCAVLSPGTNKTNCGRPCDRHEVKLRDRLGMEHRLEADVGCRNTLFNAIPQSAAEVAPVLVQKGVRSFRIELLDERPADIERIVAAYRDLLAGKLAGREVWSMLNAANRVGVTRGTLEERRNPLAII